MREGPYNLPPGRTLGSNYYVVEFLGGGWEGEVYKVEERRTGIIRAAKLFYPSDRGREAPLLRYARKLYKLRFCSIVTQYHHRDSARISGQNVDFLVSDIADGEMLSSYLERQRKKRLPPFEALHLLYALAIGVEQIHFLGEYHGDIHSDNIMVKRRGLGFDVRLIDFLDLGRSTKDKIQDDVYLLIQLLYEMIGGTDGYRRAGEEMRRIILGRKRSLISRRFKMAGHLRLALENIDWK
jgi:serine/threonine protein kinase